MCWREDWRRGMCRTGVSVMKKIVLPMIAAGAIGLINIPTAAAYQAGDMIARAGTHYVNPKSDNNDTVGVDGAWGLTGSFEYFVAPNLAADLLVAVPFKHDITLNADGSKVASTNDLPPVLSLVWYPAVAQTVHPYVGAGVNYTIFFNEKTKGALDGTKLKLDSSVGVAALVGVSFDLNKSWSVVVDARYAKIGTKAKVDGNSVGTVNIDPFVYGISVGYNF